MAMQQDWRYCQKCHEMFFDGYADKGLCPAGGGHAAAGYNFALPHTLPETPTAQGAWRYCMRCHAMFFDGYPDKGRCPAGGGHAATGYNFVLPHDLPETPTAQGAWRYCAKCHALFFDGYPDKGRCPAAGGHAAAGYNFVLPHEVPAVLDFDFNPIVFESGVAVGGHAHLTIRQDGSYTFSGHFHGSGALSYDVALSWVVRDGQGMAYTFQHKGHVAGTFEPGSRDDDWRIDSRDGRIADHWANLGASTSGLARASARFDIGSLTKSILDTLGPLIDVLIIVAA